MLQSTNDLEGPIKSNVNEKANLFLNRRVDWHRNYTSDQTTIKSGYKTNWIVVTVHQRNLQTQNRGVNQTLKGCRIISFCCVCKKRMNLSVSSEHIATFLQIIALFDYHHASHNFNEQKGDKITSKKAWSLLGQYCIRVKISDFMEFRDV